jgi:hypothetical protein
MHRPVFRPEGPGPRRAGADADFQAVDSKAFFLAYLLGKASKSLVGRGFMSFPRALPTKLSTDFVDKNIAFVWQGITRRIQTLI